MQSTLISEMPKRAKSQKSRKSELVIVSNRLPVQRDGSAWKTSPGGLVSALTPILQGRPSTWIGWTGTAGRAPSPFEHDGIRNRPISLSKAELETFYEGFSNRTLWPLYHDALRTPEYHRRWWRPYVDVNWRFAQATAEVVNEDGAVWVHDYHLQLAPAMIRELRPDVKIGFFLHIPFPPQELFSRLPWRRQILEGLLGADVVGFQTRIGAQNFSQLCKRFTSAVGTRDALEFQGRTIHVGAFPISVDVPRFERLAESEEVLARSERLRSKLGSSRRIILGVDRLDYTKGIDIRLRAFQELLRSGKTNLHECVFVQVAVPSRERVAEYQELRSQVERLVGEINGEFGELGQTPVHYLHRGFGMEELVALYLAADVMIVTPLRDGMNLVAKEYVATRLNESGVLLLSEFTGSANELRSALRVNPHDIDGLVNTLDDALHMPDAEKRRRMRSMRRVVKSHNVYDWANRFLGTLSVGSSAPRETSRK